MSGKKRLQKSVAANRVVAIPSKKVKKFATDNGSQEIQLYNIHRMY